MRVSLSLFETLFDCLALPYHFINICPCFWLYPLVLVTIDVGVGEIQLIVF